jgi:hypothetical protein
METSNLASAFQMPGLSILLPVGIIPFNALAAGSGEIERQSPVRVLRRQHYKTIRASRGRRSNPLGCMTSQNILAIEDQIIHICHRKTDRPELEIQ